MSHKKFQHFIKWFDFFIRAKTNMQKKKGKIKQKIKGKAYLSPRAKPAQPAHPAHQGHGGLLPRPAHPSCSVECPRAQPGGRHATSLPGGLPGVLIAPWRRTRVPRLHSPPPEPSPPPLSPLPSTPEKN